MRRLSGEVVACENRTTVYLFRGGSDTSTFIAYNLSVMCCSILVTPRYHTYRPEHRENNKNSHRKKLWRSRLQSRSGRLREISPNYRALTRKNLVFLICGRLREVKSYEKWSYWEFQVNSNVKNEDKREAFCGRSTLRTRYHESRPEFQDRNESSAWLFNTIFLRCSGSKTRLHLVPLKP